jgi:hypothetical protein
VIAGVTDYDWIPDWEPSPAAKFVKRYQQHRIGYHYNHFLHLCHWEYFGFLKAITGDDVLLVKCRTSLYFSSASKSETFQKYMLPLSFSTGAHKGAEYVMLTTDRLVSQSEDSRM